MTGIKLAILSGQNPLDIVPANITGFTVSVTVFAYGNVSTAAAVA